MSPVEATVLSAHLATLAVLSTYGLHRLFILWLRWRYRGPQPTPRGFDTPPLVTVQLPIFNERNVVERLIDATCAMDWGPLQVQILDDSTDDTTVVAERVAASWRARGRDVQVIHRTDRTGYKAGALEAATPAAKGDYLAVFDADFVPTVDFLRQVMPAFADRPEVGMVQARWGHINEQANLLTRLSAVLLNAHFTLEHSARHRSGRFFNFNGTAGVWRRACVTDAGGWQHDTVTEDLDLSYRAQLAGWSFVYLDDVVVPAELPADMRAFRTQQHRWSKGTIQVARKLLPRIMRAPVPLRIKAEALVHMTSNFAYPLVLVMALLMPPAIAIRGHGGLTELLLLDLPAFIAATASVTLFYTIGERQVGGAWGRRLWRVPFTMALGIGISVNQARAVFEGLFGHDITFLRTPKTGAKALRVYGTRADATTLFELAMAAYQAAAIPWAMANGYWASLPFMLLFCFGFGYVGLSSLLPGRLRLFNARAAAGA